MQISKELIEAFFLHQCTPEEAQKVVDYLKANPGEVENYLPVEEWQTSGNMTLLPQEFWNRHWDAIQSGNARGRMVRTLKRISIAAIFLIALGISVFYFVQKPSISESKTADISEDFKTDENKTQSMQSLTLLDGSVVELAPKASITYKNGFGKASRDIVLKGEATFNVAKDSMRPFTVYSGNISTTALGTIFKVVYWEDGSKTKVLLYEGKVVVKSAKGVNKRESYLLPGDVLSYQDNLVEVSSGRELKKYSKDEEVLAETSPAHTEANQKPVNVPTAKSKNGESKVLIPNWYRFEKESLPNVFEQLAALYNVKIDYYEALLEHKYFIGKFERKETIDNILKTIANLNNLRVEKIDDSHFVIK